MSVEANVLPVAGDPADPAAIGWFERILVAVGDRLNPILVKETRQALKSRQFVITFSLLLMFGLFWSFFGVALVGPAVHYGSYGPTMFGGYFLILTFPLLVVVPFSAFRSLAAEQEERTYEMLSITALGPRQIVWGKFGSAAMQMLVYLSAITPCLAFTYMLRGISFPMILYSVFWVSIASLCLSMGGLFLGTLATEKYLQVIVSVLAIIGLFWTFVLGCQIALSMLAFGEDGFGDEGFWIGNAAMLTFVAGCFLLVVEAAAARITFASDNRSTRLRVAIIIVFALWVAWMTYAWVDENGDDGVVMFFAVFATLYWCVLGAMMTGESRELSLRVQRQLPRSTLGRIFLTWLNPGPGTGYMFAIGGMSASFLISVIGAVLGPIIPGHNHGHLNMAEHGLWFALMGLAYGTFFLGLGLLAIRVIRKVSPVGVVSAAFVQCLIVLLFSAIPAMVHLMGTYRGSHYSLLQVLNPMWTLGHIASEGMPAGHQGALLTIVPLAAALVLAVNLPSVVRELRYVRVVKPQRVAEEDAQIAAEKAPPEPTRMSPWDD